MPLIETNRESIIKKSIHLFKVHGYYNTTMAAIGGACGLIKGSIYHHFKSKEDLALACMKYIHEYFNREIFSVAKANHLPPKDQLKLLTEKVEEYFVNSEGGCLLGNFSLEISNNIPSLKEEIIKYFKDWEEAIFKILKSEFGQQQAREKAMQVISATQGSIMFMRLYENSDAFKIQNREIIDLLP